MSFDQWETDDWQLDPEPQKIDRPKLLKMEIEMEEKEELPVKLCGECDEPMYAFEALHDLCKRCSVRRGIMRTCDMGRP